MYRDVDYSLPTPDELLEEMYRAQQPGSPPKFGPPNKIPEKPPTAFKIDSGSIRPCRYRMTYLWLRNGSSFWAYLTFVGPTSVSGWRWDRRRWRFFGVSNNQIESFVC